MPVDNFPWWCRNQIRVDRDGLVQVRISVTLVTLAPDTDVCSVDTNRSLTWQKFKLERPLGTRRVVVNDRVLRQGR